jgi:hypothetical protein
MKRNLIVLLSLLLTAGVSFAKDAYNITVTLKGSPNTMYYLGYYFGDKQYLRDSAVTDKLGKMVFRGDKPIEGGVYLIATAQKGLLFDFILSENVFSLETDITDVIPSMKIKGSPENDVFFAYTKFTSKVGKEAGEIDEKMKKAKESKDTAETRKLQDRYRQISIELADYRKGVLAKNPTTLLAKIFKMMT